MTEALPITVLVQTKNEAVGISACLKGLQAFDEVIVVDSNSTDATVEIAQSLGFRVENFTWNGLYPKKKQWQLENLATRNDWILFIDADEVPTAELIAELHRQKNAMRDGRVSAFDIPLDYVFSGRVLRYGHRVVKRALVQRQKVHFPVIDDLDAPGMGELEGHYQPVTSGGAKQLRGAIRHDDKDPVRTWFDRHNRYSDWEAFLRTRPEVKDEAAKRRSRQGRIFDKVPFKPLAFFAYAYVARRGFLDGRPGLDYAIALSTYYWQIGLKVRELNRAGDDRGNGTDAS
ncbi:glycosyltransferase family 2 protein [Arthrobacter sp. OAP107]|uniref:glycosyltransferase family 2 protein n=1 Tax=Arthrobacter sp. OAP107 TaxID=3156445 RepID=UPI00339B67E1